MFSNQKNNLVEEIEASPFRFKQFVRAAVSSSEPFVRNPTTKIYKNDFSSKGEPQNARPTLKTQTLSSTATGATRLMACCFLLVLGIKQTVTDENVPSVLQSTDELLSTSNHFQLDRNPTVRWPQANANAKNSKIDVKAELKKLDSSYIYQNSWPSAKLKLGQVTAVSFDKAGNVVIFNRVDRIWVQNTFNNANVFLQRKKGPIRENTILALDPENGTIVYGWGKNLFYMPHGLTVDFEDNVWVTDVALHQVFKFGYHGSNDTPLMTLGIAFMPGNNDKKFCKPTSVAVLNNGDFFVADGYCNARILKYSKTGEKILSWGQNSFSGTSYNIAPKNYFAIPHALTLIPEQELICAADRENGRVQCFYWINGTYYAQYHSPIIGDRLFSMDYTPADGGRLVIVNGPSAEFGFGNEHYNEVLGFVFNIQTEKVVSKFGPNDLSFQNPHDVAVTADGNEIFVAELNPMRIHKFLHKRVAKPVLFSLVQPTTTSGAGSGYNVSTTFSYTKVVQDKLNLGSDEKIGTHQHPSGTAILVASLMLLFAVLTFVMAWIIARRKRGISVSSVGQPSCLLFGRFGSRNRRHAWDFPTKTEGFKLSGLLMDRTKHNGFEKLDQNASDEETETTSNINNIAPFA